MNDSFPCYQTRAYAKVNLALAVGTVDADSGLHPICSWMHAIDLYDRITIQALETDQESRYQIVWGDGDESHPVEWSTAQDLAFCAHKLVEAKVGRALPVDLRIEKQIPAGGGLGGGSADAAAVLCGLNTLFELGLSQDELCKIAGSLGSDIPFFIDESRDIVRPAIVEGVGDRITRLISDHAGVPITLFLPDFGCPTGKVYKAFDSCSRHQIDAQRVRLLVQSLQIDEHGLFNDLGLPAIDVVPELGEIKERIEHLVEQPVHVSGSGSTLFVIGEVDSGIVNRDQIGVEMVQCCLI
tara:strand:+ start:321415 stop:322305 length:891 start_codon:yes stop_codon:yes gene_type:complete